jgi:hypothetical protein
MCEQNVEFVYVKPGGTYRNPLGFEGLEAMRGIHYAASVFSFEWSLK